MPLFVAVAAGSVLWVSGSRSCCELVIDRRADPQGDWGLVDGEDNYQQLETNCLEKKLKEYSHKWKQQQEIKCLEKFSSSVTEILSK